jgi:hypothetical protein
LQADRITNFRQDHDLISEASQSFFCKVISRLGQQNLALAKLISANLFRSLDDRHCR